jgi:two-component system cell cycle sensor histidine kinase/response regulator CckA
MGIRLSGALRWGRALGTPAVAILLATYIGFLLIANYRSQIELQKTALQGLVQDKHKRATALSYFFAERKNDLKNLAESREMSAFFENRALGMSMEYGLRASLLAISERFSDLIGEKKIGEDMIYCRVVFVDSSGEVLVDSMLRDLCPRPKGGWKGFLAPENPHLTVTTEDNMMMVSIPYFFKDKFAGQIIASITSQPVYDRLVETGGALKGFACIASRADAVYPRDGSGSQYGASALAELQKVEYGNPVQFKVLARDGAPMEIVAVRIPVEDTPFSLIYAMPASEVIGRASPRHLIMVMGTLAVVIFSAVVIFLRINMRNMVLQARFDEASKAKQQVEEKNRQLQEEAVRRQRAEDALQEANDSLEVRIGQRTAELKAANEQLQSEIRERSRAEEALRESEKKYRDLVDNSLVGVYKTSLKGDIIYANEALAKMFEFESPEEMTAKGVISRYKNSKDRESFLKIVKKSGRINNFEVEVVTRTGVVKDVILSGLLDGDTLSGMVMDITERKRSEKEKDGMQAQLLHAQKLEAVGTLAGGVAHDFNNLLQAIQGFTELLLLRKEENESGYQELRKIAQAADRGARLTRQLLTFSRKVESKRRPIDLNHEVKQVSSLLERTIPKMIQIELELSERLGIVYADPVQVEQVLMNLAVNAKDAMPEGGKLIIGTENLTLNKEFCSSHIGAKPGDYVLLTVSDTGCGMSRETIEHIFEPFYTTKGPGSGTGLGLAIVYGIVKSHDGYINCCSEVGEGTTFRIYLPVTDQVAEAPESGEAEVSLKGGTEIILLVDDEESIRTIGQQLLRRFGYVVFTAAEGETALEIYAHYGDRIHLVILDLMMPGMGGTKCLDGLLSINAQARVLIASGHTPEGPTRSAFEGRVKGFIGKPYRVKELLKVIREVLDEN